MHPSYFKNERYQQLYNNVVGEGKAGGVVQPPPQEVSHKRHAQRDAAGIPLSNQILYEKLDYDSEDRAAVDGGAGSRHGDNFSELRGSTKGRPSEQGDQESAYPPPADSGKDAKHLSKKSHHLLPSSIQSKLPTLSLRNLKQDRGGMVRQSHEASLQGPAGHAGGQMRDQGSHKGMNDVNFDHLSSVQELKQVTMDMDPRASSIWTKKPVIQQKVDPQQAFMSKLLRK